MSCTPGSAKRSLIPSACSSSTSCVTGPLTVGELSDALQISQSNCSQHLAILRDRGVVTAERSGTSVSYALRSDKVVQAVDLLREFMAEDLGTRSRLGRAASRMPRGVNRR